MHYYLFKHTWDWSISLSSSSTFTSSEQRLENFKNKLIKLLIVPVTTPLYSEGYPPKLLKMKFWRWSICGGSSWAKNKKKAHKISKWLRWSSLLGSDLTLQPKHRTKQSGWNVFKKVGCRTIEPKQYQLLLNHRKSLSLSSNIRNQKTSSFISQQ